MHIGWNANPQHPLPGAGTLIRVPAWQLNPALLARIRAAGFEAVLVLDRQSLTVWGWLHGSFRGSCARLAQIYPDLKYVEAGNEPDGTGDPSSAQSKADYYALISAARASWPHATIIAGGLVAIAFDYFDGIQQAGADVAGFHPYAQDADSLPALVTACRFHTALPLWATEWGTDAISDPHERAVWASNFLIALWQLGVEVALCYRWDPDGSGFVVAGTEMEAAIVDAIPNLAGPPPDGVQVSAPTRDPWDSIELITAGFTPASLVLATFGVPRSIEGIVWHDMEGYEAGALATWNHGAAGAHLSVLRDGHIVLNVKPEDAAWHAGTTYSTGRTPFWKTHNANPATLGVECEGFVASGYTDAQIEACIRLGKWVRAAHGVEPLHVIDQLAGYHLHAEISNQRSDPGSLFPLDQIMARVSAST